MRCRSPKFGLGADFRANIAAALSDATQATADKVSAFVSVFTSFGDSISGLGPALATLDPTKITAFVDALGGAQAFFDAFAYLNANFLTSAERTAQATQQLTDAFAQLGVAVPQTHREFLDLVNAAIAAGNVDLASSLERLAPLFVEVRGTADQAAAATQNLANAASDAAQTIQDAANTITTSVGSVIKQAVAQANDLLSKFSTLANESPGDFGDKLGIQIGLINDAIAAADRSQFTSSTAFDSYVGTLRNQATKLSSELGRFTVLSAQYDASRAEQLVSLEEWYSDQKTILARTPDPTSALAALDSLFAQKWKSIVDGVSTGVDGTLDQLQKLKQGIADYLRGLATSDLSALTPQQQLTASHDAFYTDLAAAQGGDQTALGNLTKDAAAYLKVARDAFASSSDFTSIYESVTQALASIAGTTTTGLPLPSSSSGSSSSTADSLAPLVAALPIGSSLASSEDVQTLRRTMETLIGALADSNSADVDRQTATLRRSLSEVREEIGAA